MRHYAFRAALSVLFVFSLFCLVACDYDSPKPASGSVANAATGSAAASEAAAAREAGGTVSVASTSIRDREVIRRNKPFVVTFSAPMVNIEEVGSPVLQGQMPFTLLPPVEGEGRWVTPSSFSFQARGGYAPGTDYRVEFSPTMKALDGRPVQHFFSFKTRATAVSGVEAGSLVPGSKVTVFVAFDDFVSADALKQVLSVANAKTGAALPYNIDLAGESQHHPVVVDLATKPEAIVVKIMPDTAASAQGGVGLAEAFSATINLAAGQADVQATSEQGKASTLKVNSAYYHEDSESGDLKAVFFLSASITQRDYAKYIKVSPERRYSISDGGTTLTVEEEVPPGSTVILRFLPGLTEANGRVVQEERAYSLKVGNREPKARFADAGHYLTPASEGHVGVNISNIDKVTLSLVEYYENNLPLLSVANEETRFGRQVAFREVEVSTPFNERVRKSVDIASLAGKRKGVFQLTITAYTRDTSSPGMSYNWAGSDNRMIVLSDIGLTVRSFPSGMTVFANSLASTKPMKNVKIRAYTESNQRVFEGVTDENGVLSHTRNRPWSADKDSVPAVIIAESAEDSTFLSFANAGDLDPATSGVRPYLGDGFEAYVYTPRGVFKPGETVQLKTFVRNASHMPPEPFPVQFVVTSPRGSETANGTAMLSDEGGADFAFVVPRTSATGEYMAEVLIPGQKKSVLGRATFSVEDFVPPRLEVSVEPKKELLFGSDVMPVTLVANYLFGAPGAGLRYELGYRAVAAAFIPQDKAFARFRFGDGEKEFAPQVKLSHLEGELDPNGTKPIDFPLPQDWAPPAKMEVMLIGSVREDSGRWVTRTGRFDYIPGPYLLGIGLGNDNPAPRQTLTLDIAALTPTETAADAGIITAELMRVQTTWFTVRQYGRYKYVRNERFVPVAEQRATMAKGMAAVTFTPPDAGQYLVRVKGKDGVTASRRFGVWGAEGAQDMAGLGRMDAVEAVFDKKEYRPGEVARLSLKAPFAGTLLLGVEHAEQISTRVLEMPTPTMQVDIPVTAEMTPSAIVTAWVYRPVTGNEREWLPHRAYGGVSLPLSSAERTLAVRPETPARATPAAPLAIPFTVVDAQGNPVAGEFSVAFVDEGILSLTAFSTPSPLEFFMAPRKSRAVTHDSFDMLLRPEKNASPFLKPGGGGMDAYLGSLSPQQIFLTAFLPTVKTDKQGRGLASFDLPEYSGKARLMIVGAAKGAFASSSAQVPVSRDIVVESAAPLAVAPGDTFTLTVRGFVLDPALDGKGRITLTASGPVAFVGKGGREETSLTLPLRSDTPVQLVSVKAREATGMGSFAAAVSVPGRNDLTFVRKVETAVRSPYPRTSSVAFGLVGSKGLVLAPAGKWVPGGATMSLVASDSPIFAVLPALQFLREYPHGCLEQTVSRAWPWLGLAEWQAKLEAKGDADLARGYENSRKASLAEVVAHVFTMQTADGGFAMWPGGSEADPWKSVNAYLFLAEAKASVPLPETPFKLATRYMNFLLAVPDSFYSTPLVAASTKSFAAFALTRAGEAPLGWLQHLAGQKKTPSGQIFLAAAQSLVAGNGAALRELERSFGSVATGNASFGQSETLESTMRNMALRLYAWSLVEPGSSEAGRLFLALSKMLLENPSMTTQEAGFSALAFGLYAEKNALGKNRAASLIFENSGGQRFATVKSLPQTVSLAGLVGPETREAPLVSVTAEGSGQAHVLYSVRGVPAAAPVPFANGLSVTRRWLDDMGNDLLATNGVVTLKRGQRVTVSLYVAAQTYTRDVVVSDLLPGGFEMENPRLKTAGAIEAQEGSKLAYDMHMDAREDRIVLAFAGIGAKGVEYRYTARAIFDGQYTIPPVAAEAMYNPQVSAIGKGGQLRVTE